MKNANFHHQNHWQRTNSKRPRQPCESRIDWALVYPNCRKTESWQSDFTGVVRSSVTGERYWVNVWADDRYRLRLSAKDALVKSPVCRLAPVGPGQCRGELPLCDEFSEHEFRFTVALRETSAAPLEVHFSLADSRRIKA
jgi:hypothetical protein